jgi:hypothetical protein
MTSGTPRIAAIRAFALALLTWRATDQTSGVRFSGQINT